MRVTVRIDRLIVEGTALAPGDRAALPAALHRELARLLTAWPGDRHPAAGRHPGGRPAAGAGTEAIAAAVAAAVHRALRPALAAPARRAAATGGTSHRGAPR